MEKLYVVNVSFVGALPGSKNYTFLSDVEMRVGAEYLIHTKNGDNYGNTPVKVLSSLKRIYETMVDKSQDILSSGYKVIDRIQEAKVEIRPIPGASVEIDSINFRYHSDDEITVNWKGGGSLKIVASDSAGKRRALLAAAILAKTFPVQTLNTLYSSFGIQA